MLRLASMLEEKAAKLKQQALAHMTVVLSGSQTSEFWQFLEVFFGKTDEGEMGSEIAEYEEEPDPLGEAPQKNERNCRVQLPKA